MPDQTSPHATCIQKGNVTIYVHNGLPKRSDLPECPVETCLQIMSNKWKPLILRDLLSGNAMRFNELQRSVSGISQKVLTANLRQLENDGIIERRVYKEVPPHVEYALTKLGQSLHVVIDAMGLWGTHYQNLARA